MSTEMAKIEKVEYRAKCLCLKGFRGKKIYKDMLNTLGELSSSYATLKNWIANFKMGKFSIVVEGRLGRPVCVSIHVNIEAVYDMIL